MQNIKAAMSSGERVRGGQPFGFIDHIRKVADLDPESATRPVSLKLRPEQSCLARPESFPELSEAEGISQLIVTQRSEGQSTSLGLNPSYGPRRVRIVSVEGKQKTGVRAGYHFPAASWMISSDSAEDITRDPDRSRFTAGLWDQSTVWRC
jgi:hypothetical protein